MTQGEGSGIDFNFEELEFIDEVHEGEQPVDEGLDPNTATDEELAEASKLEAEAAEAQKKVEDTKEIEEAAEGTEVPEGVGGSATDESAEEGTSPQLFQTLTTLLKEEGVLSSVDDSSLKDIKGSTELVNLIKEQIKSQELNDLSDVQKKVLNDMREGVSSETADQYKRAMDQLEAITSDQIVDDKQVRFDLIYQDFISKGFSADKANRYSNMSFDTKQDLEDAKEAKENLKKTVTTQYDAKKQRDLDKIGEEQVKKDTDEKELKERILDTEEVTKGLKVPENVRKEIYAGMNTMISTNPTTGVPENALMKHQRENPTDFGHKLYFVYKVTDGFKDFSYFGKKSASGTVKNLETILRQSAHVSGGGDASFSDDGESHLFDIDNADNIIVPGQ